MLKQFWQMRILISKNILLRRRTKFLTTMEALVPFAYTIIYFLVRGYGSQHNHLEYNITTAIIDSAFKPNHHTIIGYAPRSKATDIFMSKVESLLFSKSWFNDTTNVQMLGFKSEYSMVMFERNYPNLLSFALAFENISYLSSSLPEKLNIVFRLKRNSSRHESGQYLYSEAQLLELMMEVFISICSGKKQNISVEFDAFSPTLDTRMDISTRSDLFHISLTIIGLTAFLIWRNVFLIASERECCLLIIMEQMGVNTMVYWLSWLITTMAFNELICMYFAWLLFFDFFGTKPAIEVSDPSAIILLFSAFAFSISAYSILGSLLFKKAETCSAVASIIYVVATFPTTELSDLKTKDYIASFMFASVNFVNAIGHIGEMEIQGVGYGWQRLAVYKKRDYFIGTHLFTGVVYLFLAWVYYNAVLFHRVPLIGNLFTNFWTQESQYKEIERDGKTFSKISIRAEKLSAGSTRKVNDVTLIMLEDSITVVTGHELSGKATFMSVLKGEVKPTKGTVTVYGLDIVKDIMAIKPITGVCPKEHTAIFTDLTVLENLQFFAKIKHVCQDKPMTDVHVLAKDFFLHFLYNVQVSWLETSYKRLLQVAIAYIGENKVILLEDPSLGMDIRTKYRLWSVIRNKAFEKTVVVNTNIVNEAEMIGDRIAIFVNGELRCCGSLPYVNKYLGAGYFLTIDKMKSCNEERIEYVVCNIIHDSALTQDSKQIMIFWLPLYTTDAFHGLFSLLYNHRHKLGISNFSVNATTLNDAIIDLNEIGYIEKTPIKTVAIDPNLAPTASDFSIHHILVRDKINDMLNNIKVIKNDSMKPNSNVVDTKKAKQAFAKIQRSFSTDAFLIHAILKSMAKSRYVGRKLLYSQTCALFKKRLILSSCAIHIELLQIIVLFLLSSWGNSPIEEDECLLHDCKQMPLYKTNLRTAVPYTQGYFVNYDTKVLVNNYMNIVNSPSVISMEFNEKTTNMTTVSRALTDLKIRAFIGARFDVPNASRELKATAYYLPYDIDVESSILRSLSAIMNTFLCFATNSTRFSVYTSIQNHISDSLVTSRIVKDHAIKLSKIYAHHATMLNALTTLMVPYFVVTERQTGSKDMQILSGTSLCLYWLTHFIFDYATYVFLCNMYTIYSTNNYDTQITDLMWPLSLLYLVNGVMMIVYIYVLQSFFNSAPSAVGFIMIFNYCLGNPTLTVIAHSEQQHIPFKDYLSFLQLLAPPHLLPLSMTYLIMYGRSVWFCNNYNSFCTKPNDTHYREDCCRDVCEQKGTCLVNQFGFISSFYGRAGTELMIMTLHIIFWSVVLALLEHAAVKKCFAKRESISYETIRGSFNKNKIFTSLSTVASGIFNVNRSETMSYTDFENQSFTNIKKVNTGIILHGVEKVKGNRQVVSDICLNIKEGELFCFAAADIEAPCTIVNMIGGLEVPTSGVILVHGKSFDNFGRPRVNNIGYCSNKTTGVLPTMTAQESLWMFASLRGVAKFNLKRLVDIYLSAFHLDGVANNNSSNYSECELRRLSIASALIGEPELSLLCDPLYALDSESKEAFWRWLTKLINLKKTIVMASDTFHGMRKHAAYIMILVNGMPVSHGTAESVESLYCKGYTLCVKFDPCNNIHCANTFLSLLKDRFPKSKRFHGHQDHLYFHVPYEYDCLADIFATVESIKKHIKIENYRVHKANLDQILTAAEKAYFLRGLTPSEMLVDNVINDG